MRLSPTVCCATAFVALLIAFAGTPVLAEDNAPQASPAENVTAFHRARATEAMDRHAAPLVVSDELITRELWAMTDTIDTLARWEASEARRLARGGKPVPGTADALARHATRLEKRAVEFLDLCIAQIGTISPYYNDYYAQVRTGVGEVLHGAGVLLHHGGQTERAVELLQRARTWPGQSAANGTHALESVAPRFWPEGVRASQREIADELRARFDDLEFQQRVRGATMARFLSADETLQAELQERRLAGDPSLLLFVHAFAEKLHSPRHGQLRPYFSGDAWPEGEVAERAARWDGWHVVSPGIVIEAEEFAPDQLDVQVRGMLLENEAGDLWSMPFSLQVRRVGGGRYAVEKLQGRLQEKEAAMGFQELLKTRVVRDQHARQVREALDTNK